MGYETSKLITSDTDLERGNAQREDSYYVLVSESIRDPKN